MPRLRISGVISPLIVCAFSSVNLPQDCEHSFKLKDVCYAYCGFSIILFFSQLSKVGFCVASFPKIDSKNTRHCFFISRMCTNVGMGG